MPQRRVLVTGARGFAGRHLVAALQDEGTAVVGLDQPCATETADPDWLLHQRRLGDGDPAARADELADLLADGAFDTVFHLAGQSSAHASFQDPAGTVRANLLGTLEVLEALRRLQERGRAVPRLLAVGSGEEYGGAAAAGPCREADPVLPLSPYATSKAAATQLCVHYHRSFDLPVVPVRAFSHTGIGHDARFVFPSFAAQIAAIEADRAEPVMRTGDLSAERDFLDVRDAVAGYMALAAVAPAGQVFNVCSGSTLTIREGLQILLGLSSAAIAVETDPARLRPADIPRLVGDPTTIRAATGWRPRYEFTTTLRDLLEAARRNVA